MSDRMRSNKSRVLVVLVTISFIITGLPSSLSGKASREPSAGSAGPAKAGAISNRVAGIAATPVQAPPPTYNKLLQDDSNGDLFRFNSTTGDYQYSKCGNGFTLIGTGTVTSRGNIYTLSQNGPDRRVTATIDDGVHKGSAGVQFPPGTNVGTITDRDTTNDPGLSDTTPPQVGITAPNGGEIVDTGSVFNISWTASDDLGVTSQDILLSTDGGATFSPIVSGLAGSVNQYSWTVPLMINKQTARVRVVARDAACNASRDDTDSNFTIWNPPASFTHSAEAALFFAGQGYTSTISMTNTSSNALVVELDPHRPDGNATQNYPYQLLLIGGASATLDVASLYTIGPSGQNPDVADMIDGGIRMRHNGVQDNDVRAVIVSERTCSERFTTPFTYAGSSQSAMGTMQCSPMYYVDYDTNAFVSFQNVTNAPQIVQLTCNYGTGVPGTPNGQFKNQPIILGPQRTYVLNLRSIWDQFGGAGWGSMDVFTTNPRSVVCHSVMMSAENNVAWDCPFLDPAMSVSTTKVAETVMLDYNTAQNAYIMVCNTSATDTRTVTASFKTSTGVVLPPAQVTLAPGGQRMITLNAQQLLSPGGSTVADARLTYSGNPSDIAAAGCSVSTSAGRAVSLKFKEASASDGRRLTSPYFRFDQSVSGKLQISNLGSSSVNVGARMVFANSTAKALKTAIVSIPAGGVGTIDLASAVDGVPDNVDSLGRVDLIHSGPAGSVTAAVTAFGCGGSGPVIPMDGGPPIDPVTLFPTSVVIIPGACTVVDAITDGTITNPPLSSSNVCFGTAITTHGTGPNSYQTSICVPIGCTGDVPITWTPPGGGGGGGTGDEVDLVTVQANFGAFTTVLGTRLNPNGTTQFTLTAQSAFPNALLQVDFVGNGGSVSTLTQGNGVSASITGTGPVNHVFLGNVKKIFVTQLNPDGTPNISVPRVLKAKNTGAYFALDTPASITSVAPTAVPVTGATVTITGTGFQTWQLGTAPNVVTVNPVVLIGTGNLAKHDQIPFTVISVAADQKTITGNVGQTPNTVSTCAEAGETPCKTFTVINPGGSDGVDSLTSENLLTINAPLPPVITGTAALNAAGNSGPATSNSIGARDIRLVNGFTTASPVTARIIGRNLNRVVSLNFGSQQVPIGPSNINSAGTRIEASVPSFCLTGANASVAVSVDDGINAPASFANGWIYTATGPLQVFLAGFQGAIVFVAGPCEHLNMGVTTWNVPSIGDGFLDGSTNCSFSNPLAASCARIINVTFVERFGLSTIFPNANFGVISWTTTCAHCTAGSGTVTGTFQADATNTNSNVTARPCRSTSCLR